MKASSEVTRAVTSEERSRYERLQSEMRKHYDMAGASPLAQLIIALALPTMALPFYSRP
jgi:hypothetical protein